MAGKAEGKARIDYGLHVAITNLTDAVKAEIPSLPSLGVSTIKIFMAYKGTPLYTADEDLFEAMQIAREAGVLVLVHAENGDVIAKLQAEALERGDTDPQWHALTRPELVEAEATNRAIRLAEIADTRCSSSTSRAPPRSRRCAAPTPAGARSTPRPARSTSFRVQGSRAPGLRGRQVRVLAADARPVQPPGAVARAAGRRPADLRLGPLLVQLHGQKELGRDDFTAIPNGLPGLEERPSVLWTEGVRGGHISEQLFVAVLSTNQARVHGMVGRKGAIVPGNDADIVVWDPDMTITATQSNRHNRLDHTPYEGKTLIGGPTEVYIRGALAYRDGEVVAEAGSGRFIERAFRRAAPAAAVR